jgi:hypothetical protein
MEGGTMSTVLLILGILMLIVTIFLVIAERK